jgi:hypothetical protein
MKKTHERLSATSASAASGAVTTLCPRLAPVGVTWRFLAFCEGLSKESSLIWWSPRAMTFLEVWIVCVCCVEGVSTLCCKIYRYEEWVTGRGRDKYGGLERRRPEVVPSSYNYRWCWRSRRLFPIPWCSSRLCPCHSWLAIIIPFRILTYNSWLADRSYPQ